MDNLNKNRKIPLKFRHIISIVPMLTILIVITLSWFTHDNSITNSVLSMTVEDSNDVYISTDAIDYSLSCNMVFPNEFNLVDISGNGETFYKPIIERQETVINDRYKIKKDVITSYTPVSDIELNNSVFMFDFYCDIKYACELYLKDTSSVLPVDIDERLSSLSGFSRDYIAGAIRVGFFQKIEDSYELVMVWIPNSKIQFDNENTSPSLNPNGIVEDSYTFVTGQSLENVITINTNGNEYGNETIENVKYVWGDIQTAGGVGSVPICTASAGVNSLRLVIWVEGTDREASAYLAGGLINVNLTLVTIE